jgi:hypothetical protein
MFLRNVVSFHLAGFSLGFLFYAETGGQYVPPKRHLLAFRWFLSLAYTSTLKLAVSMFLRNVAYLHIAGFSLGFLFYAEDGVGLILRNVAS